MLIEGSFHGHPAFWLQNDLLRVGVLPQKGADIFELTYRPAGIQFLMETPWGLKPPGSQAPADFLENYEGGWQELLPNHNDACEIEGKSIPMHGEVALLPWEMQILRDDPQETVIRLQVHCRVTPFRLERTMRVQGNEARLWITEKVTNTSPQSADFVWGHHLTLGGNFLEDGCSFAAPVHAIHTPEVLYEAKTARLAAGQTSDWPFAQGRDGKPIDLRSIPGPGAHTHDDVILSGLERGQYSVTNPRLKLRFELEWEKSVFPWIMFWQPYGGAEMPPLTGIYGVGIEPWTARYPLAEAIQQGQARRLAGGESLETVLVASVFPCEDR
jgi:hypothetical protein